MKKLSLFVIIAVLFTFCDNSINPDDGKVIMPLTVGNYWIYKHFYTVEGVDLRTSEVTIHVYSDTIINNERFSLMDEFYHYSNSNPPRLYINRSDGLYGLIKTKDTSYLFKYYNFPAKLGDTVFYEGFPCVLNDLNYEITVEAGKFICYRYTWREDDFIYNLYISPGIGLIRREFYQHNVLDESVELIKYHIN